MPTMQPGRRDGHTVAFVTDMHAGVNSHILNMHNRMGTDLDWLEKYCKVMGLSGDNVNWGNTSPASEDLFIKNFIAARRNKAKYLVTSGNHDLGSGTKTSASTYPSRTGNTWATATGTSKYSHYPPGETVASGLQVVALSQDSMAFNQWLNKSVAAADARPEVKPGRGVVYPQAALDYLEARLKTGRPTIIMIHYPLLQHITNSRHWDATAAAELNDVLTKYTNVVGVLSGHHHRPMNNPYLTNRTKLTGNGRTMYVAGVNGPSAGGPMTGFTTYTQPLIAGVVSYRPGRVLVRWRDLAQRRWVKGMTYNGKGMQFVSEIPVSCQVAVTY